MRLILATAGIALLASSGSAMAVDCTKGLLWPYVRNPGDCLTDAELQAGKTGVYTGPATGQVDVSAIKPPPQTNSANVTQCSSSWYWPFGGGDCQAAPAATVSNSTSSGAKDNSSAALPPAQPAAAAPAVKPQAAVQPAQTPAAVAPAVAPTQVAQARTVECHKGVLWPFIRDNGDCPTAVEGGKGATSSAPIATSMPVSQSGAPATAQSCTRSWLWPLVSDTCATDNSGAKPTPMTIAATTSGAATCAKGTFWPFIREAGDCPTAVERGSGNISAVPVATSEPPAMPVPAAPPPPAPVMQAVAVASPPVAASCTKGVFWSFIRESGDCSTVTEKADGKNSAAPVAASEPAAMPVSAAPQPPPAPVMQAVAVASPPVAASCAKGIFWPFIRESGDCSTATEKADGKTSAVPVAANPPAAIPVSAAPPPPPAPAMQAVAVASPPAAAAAGCTKGTFWPFIRESGDCLTAAERAGGQTSEVPMAASAPAATAVAGTSTAAAMASSATATCTRSWLWPFIRESGDCQTAAERGSASTSATPINASGSAASPVAVRETTTAPEQPGPAPASGPAGGNSATCHKGLFWPFVREAGDCVTDAERAPQR